MNCIFCKLIAGEIIPKVVYEDEQVLAFLDAFPCAKGHTVVVPKKHIENLSGLSTVEWQALMTGLQNTLAKVYQVLKPGGVNVGINDRPAAGQAVQHVHWHIIPRYEGDGGGSMHSIIRSKETGDLAAVAKLFS